MPEFCLASNSWLRQIHSRLSHEQILEPLNLGLLEQDQGYQWQPQSFLDDFVLTGVPVSESLKTWQPLSLDFFQFEDSPWKPGKDIACGIDRNGKDVKIVNLQQTLLKCALALLRSVTVLLRLGEKGPCVSYSKWKSRWSLGLKILTLRFCFELRDIIQCPSMLQTIPFYLRDPTLQDLYGSSRVAQ